MVKYDPDAAARLAKANKPIKPLSAVLAIFAAVVVASLVLLIVAGGDAHLLYEEVFWLLIAVPVFFVMLPLLRAIPQVMVSLILSCSRRPRKK